MSETTKITAIVAAAWFSDCDAFISIAFNPNRFTPAKAEHKFWQLVKADVHNQWSSCDSGQTFTAYIDDVRWGGLHTMEIDVPEGEYEDFGLDTDGKPSGSANRAQGYFYQEVY